MRFHVNFRIGQEATWYEWCPSEPVVIDTIDFEVPVLLHGMANGTTATNVSSPIEVTSLTRQAVWFGKPLQPPHGVFSLRLSMPKGQPESDVEVVFRSVPKSAARSDSATLIRPGHVHGCLIEGSHPLESCDRPEDVRERLGRRVREVWIEWAKEQPKPKASWLTPWEGLSEPDREVDRRIGEELFYEGLAAKDK